MGRLKSVVLAKMKSQLRFVKSKCPIRPSAISIIVASREIATAKIIR